jgi:DNA-binding SARP family transcriptional activator
VYGGPLLGGNPASRLGERLALRFERLVTRHGETLEREGRHEAAVALYDGALERHPAAEAFHRGVMRAQLALGRRTEALQAFQRCQQSLLRLGHPAPSRETQALARQAAGDD